MSSIEQERRMTRMEERVDNIKTDLNETKGDVKEIKGTLQNLPETLVAKLDERYALKVTVDTMQETIDPLTKLRKRMWTIYIVGALTLAALANLGIEYLKQHWGK